MTDGNKRYLHASVATAVSTFADTVISRSQHCLFNQAVFQEHIFTGYIFCKIVRGGGNGLYVETAAGYRNHQIFSPKLVTLYLDFKIIKPRENMHYVLFNKTT